MSAPAITGYLVVDSISKKMGIETWYNNISQEVGNLSEDSMRVVLRHIHHMKSDNPYVYSDYIWYSKGVCDQYCEAPFQLEALVFSGLKKNQYSNDLELMTGTSDGIFLLEISSIVNDTNYSSGGEISWTDIKSCISAKVIRCFKGPRLMYSDIDPESGTMVDKVSFRIAFSVKPQLAFKSIDDYITSDVRGVYHYSGLVDTTPVFEPNPYYIPYYQEQYNISIGDRFIVFLNVKTTSILSDGTSSHIAVPNSWFNPSGGLIKMVNDICLDPWRLLSNDGMLKVHQAENVIRNAIITIQ